MTSMDKPRHNTDTPGSVESWLVSAGRDRRPGSPLNVPPVPASVDTQNRQLIDTSKPAIN